MAAKSTVSQIHNCVVCSKITKPNFLFNNVCYECRSSFVESTLKNVGSSCEVNFAVNIMKENVLIKTEINKIEIKSDTLLSLLQHLYNVKC